MKSLLSDSSRSLVVFVAGALVALACVFAPRFAGRIHVDPRPAPAPAPAPAPQPKPDWFGWRGDGGHEALAASMPRLAQAAPHLLKAGDNDTRPVLLYKAWTDLFADYPPYVPQEIGDCVSFGHAHANDLLQCVEFVLAKGPGALPTRADIQETDTEFLYGAAREVGGMLGNRDGCYGAAAVKAMTEVGVLSRRQLGADGTYSGRRAKDWGRTGPPDALVKKAAAFKLGSAARVATWEELVAALKAGSPVTICTGQGFTLARDPQGFCSARGTWGHCMFIAGVRFDRPGACVVQSWGKDMPSGPRGLDQPSFSFWVDRPAIERILAEGDSWALSKSPDFGQTASRRGAMPAHWHKAA